MKKKKKNTFRIYVGVCSEGDMLTSGTIRDLLFKCFPGRKLKLEKLYKSKRCRVWSVTKEFVAVLYKKDAEYGLNFIIYARVSRCMPLQVFQLLEPETRGKAQAAAKEARRKKLSGG